MLTVSAPGKLMLFGEHAVVYGYPCIVTAVNQRLFLTIEKTTGETVIESPQTSDTRFVEAAIQTAVKQFHASVSHYKITTKSSFTGTFGFGSSSAVTVATLFAIASLENSLYDTRKIFNAAYDSIISVQKVGSGFDVASAAFGGTLYFKKGGEVIEEVSFDKESVAFVTGYSMVKSNTVDIVNQIAEKKKKYPERVERIFIAIQKIVEEARVAITEKDWQTVGKLMNFNQEYLRDLGVSTEKLEALISAAKNAGAYGAKLSGAGGGDCMIAVAPQDKKQAVEEAITSAGGQVVPVSIGEDGVRIEENDTGVMSGSTRHP